ncbi:TRP-domain-containing protein [Schizophyllum commune Loenen D]|nr:TRP-domain-containing protein [Schizophyllum commune Loenen D]
MSLLSRLWALALSLSLISLASARHESLFTSSVSYCDDPVALNVQQFDIEYIAHNSTIFFNVSASTVEENLYASANLLVNAYGIKPINITIDLCDVLGGALCPLPQYNFVGWDWLSLPEELNINDKLPGIAFKVPDLEGYAQLQLIERDTNEVKACVQATLSNGWSMYQVAVEWGTAGLTFFALLSALLQSWASTSLAAMRLLDLIYLFQVIVSIGLLNLNYPVVYRSFALNFAWAVGLFAGSSSHSVQASIDSMRHKTGGKMADSSTGSAISLVNRALSPYNEIATVGSADASGSSGTSLSTSNFGSFLALPRSLAVTAVNHFKRSTAGDVQTVTANSANVLSGGIPIYVNSMHVGTANAFMTVFISVLILAAISLGVLALVYGIILLLSRSNSTWATRHQEMFPLWARAWGLRLGLIVFFPVLIFAFNQWTLKDSWLSILLSVILLLIVLAGVCFTVFSTLRIAKHSRPSALYSTPQHAQSLGPLYTPYREPRFYFFFIVLSIIVIKAIFIAFAHASGPAQIGALLGVEIIYFVALCALKPHPTRGSDVLAGYLSVSRIVGTGLLIAFVESMNVAAIPRVVIGIIIALIFSVATVVMAINIFLHAIVYSRFWRRKQPAEDQATLREDSIPKEQVYVDSEKGVESSTPSATSPSTSGWRPSTEQAPTHARYQSSSTMYGRQSYDHDSTTGLRTTHA